MQRALTCIRIVRRAVIHNGNISNWDTFVNALAIRRESAAAKRGAGLRILTGTIGSPALGAQLQEIAAAFPQAKWHQWESCGGHEESAGSLAAFGQRLNAIYRFDKARAIVSLDADFLNWPMPGHLRYSHDYAGARRMAAANPSAPAPRLYVAESMPSLAGGMADHRFRMRSGDVESFAEGLLGAGGNETQRAILKDLQAHRGESIVIA